MLSVQWPWIFILLPIPLLVRYLLSNSEAGGGAIKVPFYQRLLALQSTQHVGVVGNNKGKFFSATLIWLVWLALLCASARPTWLGEPVSLPQDKRDLMLAVDISRSMLAEDMVIGNRTANRLSAVKSVVGDFIEQRSGDRIGLILFGQQAYLQTPLTHDSATVGQQLSEAQSGFAGDATAIGDAIGLGIKRLKDRAAESRVLILLTDGENTAGSQPHEAAQVAKEAGVRIHTVGIGSTTRSVRSLFGGSRTQRVAKQIDESLMKFIAQETGGQYFYAEDPTQLRQIYQQLDKLEPQPEEKTFRPATSLSHWPALVGLFLSFLLAQLMRRRL